MWQVIMGSAVLAWLYHQMCRDTEHCQHHLGGCVSLLLSWAYHRVSLLRPDGFETRRFLLVERGENKLRHYKRMLNGIGILYSVVPPGIAEAKASAAAVCSLLCFAIVKWHQVDWVVHYFDGLQHIPIRPLNIDEMHCHDGRFGRGE
ncbi:hypothetical protein Ahy_B03g064087 [Arachis hypogaea]|uniref:Aminotransferase-like plant mobile domain-containing protein n=1 Tax=Arachis hypogaea TaxID=3818 RepID=A0A444ZYS0_ARAHY|nr:hypothetical protein Ahy_B03g064087 [Arachis hypogaea]